jgi:hypothetical protein
MKNLFAVAILAVAFTFTSCGNKAAETTTDVDNSLSGRAAIATCNCSAMKEMVAIGKEIKANKANEDKAIALTGKMMELIPKIQECTKSFMAEVNALPEADKLKFEAEMKKKMAKSCPDLLPNMK